MSRHVMSCYFEWNPKYLESTQGKERTAKPVRKGRVGGWRYFHLQCKVKYLENLLWSHISSHKSKTNQLNQLFSLGPSYSVTLNTLMKPQSKLFYFCFQAGSYFQHFEILFGRSASWVWGRILCGSQFSRPKSRKSSDRQRKTTNWR